MLRNPVLVWLGAVSYPLYLIHQNIGYQIMNQTIDIIGPWPGRILALAIVLLLAWAVHELVEVRLSRAINRRLKRDASHPSPWMDRRLKLNRRSHQQEAWGERRLRNEVAEAKP